MSTVHRRPLTALPASGAAATPAPIAAAAPRSVVLAVWAACVLEHFRGWATATHGDAGAAIHAKQVHVDPAARTMAGVPRRFGFMGR